MTDDPDRGTWLTTGAVAALLGVSKSTILRAINDGELPARRLFKGHYRIRQEDALAALDPAEEQ